MPTYSDTFAGANGSALGVTEVGGLAWESISGTWTRSNGRAVASEDRNATPPPIAVVDLGTGQADLSAAVGSGGDALYARVVDVNNWIRARARRWTTSSTYYVTEYQWAQEYWYISQGPETKFYEYQWSESNSGYGPSFRGNDGSSYPVNNPYLTGATRQSPRTSSSTNYQVILEKCVAGTVTQLGSYSVAPTVLRIRADGTSVQVYINGTSRISVTETVHQNATKHGIGKGPSENVSSAIDNFSIEALLPPTPTIVSPANNSTVTTGTPALQTNAGSWGGALTKVEYQIAQDVDFTVGVISLIESNTQFRASGNASLTVPEANLLTQRGWFIRARQVSESGLASNWTNPNAFTVAHSPGAINLSPSNGNGVVAGATNRLAWQFTDTSITDSQTAYRVIVERNDTSALVVDTGKITSSDQFYDIAIDPALKDVQLRWKVMVWDEEDKPSSFTNYALFIPTDAPVLVILEPADGSNVGTSRPLVRWSFAASGGRSEAYYRVTVKLVGAANPHFDSGLIGGNALEYLVTSPVIENAKSYEITVFATDSVGITVAATATVNAVYEEPDVVEFSVDDSYYEDSGYVRLTWQAESDASFIKWRIYRREVGKIDWQLLGEVSQISVTEYRDWLVPSMGTYDYYVVQVVMRFNTEVESVVAQPIRVTLGTGGYWLIDEVDSANNMRLHDVKAETYNTVSEQAEFLIVGRGRHIDEGETSGVSGNLTAQLRDTPESTARTKKQTLESLRKKKKPLYLRNPFGDIIYVALGDIGITRIAGVGAAEFVDVSVPYMEVF